MFAVNDIVHCIAVGALFHHNVDYRVKDVRVFRDRDGADLLQLKVDAAGAAGNAWIDQARFVMHQPRPLMPGDIVEVIDDVGRDDDEGFVVGARFTVAALDHGDVELEEFPFADVFAAERFKRVVPVNGGKLEAGDNAGAELANAIINENAGAAAIAFDNAAPVPDPLRQFKGKQLIVGDVLGSFADFPLYRITAFQDEDFQKGGFRLENLVRVADEDIEEINRYEWRPFDGVYYKDSFDRYMSQLAIPGTEFESLHFYWRAQEKWDRGTKEQEFAIIGFKDENLKGGFEIGHKRMLNKELFKQLKPLPGKLKIEKPKGPELDMDKVKKNLKKAVEEARKKAFEFYNVNKQRSCSAFFVFKASVNNGKVEDYGSVQEPCHYNMRVGASNARSKIVAMYDFINNIANQPEDQQKKSQALAEWILRESPWKKCFDRPPVWKNIFTHGIKMNIKRSGQELASACIALRATHEHPHTATSFQTFVDKGYDKAVAYLMAYTFYQDGKNWKTTKMFTRGHNAITGSVNAKELIHFLKHGLPKTPKAPAYAKSGSYADVYALLGKVYEAEPFTIATYMKVKEKAAGGGFAAAVSVDEADVFALADKLQKDFANA